jgi:hypothetical protein
MSQQLNWFWVRECHIVFPPEVLQLVFPDAKVPENKSTRREPDALKHTGTYFFLDLQQGWNDRG